MGRFETLATAANRDLAGSFMTARDHITLDMDSSVSPTHGAQEGAAWNGH
ncbi:hypothetical protein [Tateyamaria sp.]